MNTDSFDFTAAVPRSKASLLLPAIQRAREIHHADDDHKDWSDLLSTGGGASHSTQDALPAEELTPSYTEVEWTY